MTHTTTAATFELFIPGNPKPQGSKRHVGHGIMVESSKDLGPWRERIALAIHNAMLGADLYTGPLTIELSFVLPRPKSTPKHRTPPATRRPDLDKLARAALDALTGTALHDDAQITDLGATKRLAELSETPGVLIRIEAADT